MMFVTLFIIHHLYFQLWYVHRMYGNENLECSYRMFKPPFPRSSDIDIDSKEAV